MRDLRKAAEMMAYEVPLHELLEGVPENARLVIDSEDGMSTSFIPVGLYCKRAASALRQALAQPEKEPVDKNGSPCPEFWDWLPKAYNFDGDGSFTKYNMEVAFLAGKQSIAQQPPIAFMGTDFEGNPTKFRLNHFSGSFPLYTAPPKREWVGLTDEEVAELRLKTFDAIATNHEVYRAIEAKLKEKNSG